MNLRRYDAAEETYRRVIALQPAHAVAHIDLVALALLRNDLDAAVAHGERAVALAPQHPMAALRLGRAFDEGGEHAAAMAQYRRALQLDPGDVAYRRNLIRALLFASEIGAGEQTAECKAFGAAMAARVERQLPPPANDRDPERRLRVGWLSSDFRQHPVGRNLEPIFATRDPSRFEYVGYAEVEAPDDMTAWFQGRADLWRSTIGLSDAEVAAQIRADRIDVMIYLAGRFDHNRPQVAAWRPAPVQVSFHDPATSGLTEMDYLIADPVLVPHRTAECFTERVVRLPHFYTHRPLAGTAEPGPLPMAAAGHATFGCFNNPTKIGQPVLALWGRILDRVPDARLSLKYQSKYASERLRARVRDGVGRAAARRVEFDPHQRKVGEHLQLYGAIDIALDPFPFTGSTTTFEALWMGVPVVTLWGDTMVGRWSAATLHALELDELIAHTPEEYVEIAVRLAADPARLAALRASLRDRMLHSPLCADRRTVRHFERLLRAVWRRWCRSQPAG